MKFVCGRRGKWVTLVVWLVLFMGVAGPLAGKLSGVQKNDAAQWLPGSAESTRVVELQKSFETAETAPAVIVYERASGLTDADLAKAAADAVALASAEGVAGPVSEPIAAADGAALQLVVPVAMGADGYNKIADRIAGLREITGPGADGLDVKVAGPAGFDGDAAAAFSGVDGALLGATVLVVIVLLLFAYRSPVLWILPIFCAVTALTASQGLIYLLAEGVGLTVTGQSAGILTVLVIGAGTDYALLLIARYREELSRTEDRHAAMAAALHRAGPAVAASAATVGAGLLCLMAADMNSTRGLGPVLAIGVGVALVTMLTLLPALLVVLGRWIFWPRRPRPGVAVAETGRGWARLGTGIARRPRAIWVTASLALAALATGSFLLNPAGLTAADTFTGKPDSIAGQEALARHFPAGQNGQPVVVIAKAEAATAVTAAVGSVPGVAATGEPVVKDGLARVEATLADAPDSDAAADTVVAVREAVHAIADAKVGGPTALRMDMYEATSRDNLVIIPIVLVVILAILGLLLRAVVAPLVLVATVALSFAAALGASALIFDALGFASTDAAFPLYIFVFLVALGVDYNIFLMTRVREESARHGTREGMLRGLRATGGVITSAGLVLAGTFAVFAAMPLVQFVEIGVAVALGVLLDTFVVRSVLVTALTLDLGRRVWTPGGLSRPAAEPAAGADREAVPVP
ncbi:MMPL family transporter [Actinocorallia sp. A-T 12471]|uniref:MMPL family transporter n=1 Tax=Actinocorallia sp. A-T 12471 TaxID=3089813 RepID=UPI0029CF36D0|nr:MMPL family transporter [Actinocorallia sp. A-T 12471]MDX6741632.1 MMPL family transporter [Actinocorallia sp. A-T 12471]